MSKMPPITIESIKKDVNSMIEEASKLMATPKPKPKKEKKKKEEKKMENDSPKQEVGEEMKETGSTENNMEKETSESPAVDTLD